MKIKNEITPQSPKNKFRAEVTYPKAIAGIGSVGSVGAMTLDDAKHLAQTFLIDTKNTPGEYSVRIRENKKEYPEFDWVDSVSYKVNK